MSPRPSTSARMTYNAEQALFSHLMTKGLISPAQALAVRQYATEHDLDIRQSLVKLKLIKDEVIQKWIDEGDLSSEPAAVEGEGTLPALAAPGEEGSTQAPPMQIRTGSSRTNLLAVDTTDQPIDVAQLRHDIRADLKSVADTAASSDLVAQIFERAIEARATDVHFDPQGICLRIRFRIDGQLHDILDLDLSLAASMVSRLKVMADLNIVERRQPQDGRIQFPFLGEVRDLRVATMPTILGERVVIRIHESATQAYGFDLLGLSPGDSAKLENLCARPYGAILVAGPVGSGKTTTLYTCLSRVNEPCNNVMTIEDPIERRMAGVNQVQVDPKSDLTFGSGLRAMLRQDPDVIMIGEIRDEETAHIGIRAALTGVLVFSTIHAADAPGTLGNLYDLKIPGYMLSNTLLAVISQRLLRKICPYCRVTFEADERQLAMLDLDPTEHAGIHLARGEGCPACFNTGYLGRSGIFEIMEINDTLRELIFQQISKDVLRRVASEMGMRTLRQAAVDKVLEGATTLEEIYRVVAMD